MQTQTYCLSNMVIQALLKRLLFTATGEIYDQGVIFICKCLENHPFLDSRSWPIYRIIVKSKNNWIKYWILKRYSLLFLTKPFSDPKTRDNTVSSFCWVVLCVVRVPLLLRTWLTNVKLPLCYCVFNSFCFLGII